MGMMGASTDYLSWNSALRPLPTVYFTPYTFKTASVSPVSVTLDRV